MEIDKKITKFLDFFNLEFGKMYEIYKKRKTEKQIMGGIYENYNNN